MSARLQQAEQIWADRKPLAGSLAAKYLRLSRVPASLTDLAAGTYDSDGTEVPALIAAMRIPDGTISAVQRTFLIPGQSRPLKLSCTCPACRTRPIRFWHGHLEDSAIRLGPVAPTMGLATSVEQALAASRRYAIPVWAAGGAGRMHIVDFPRSVDHLVLFMNDKMVDSGWARYVANEQGRWISRVDVVL